MKEPKIIAIGDNVCDKYLSRGKCIREDNVSIHAYMQNGMVSIRHILENTVMMK